MSQIGSDSRTSRTSESNLYIQIYFCKVALLKSQISSLGLTVKDAAVVTAGEAESHALKQTLSYQFVPGGYTSS